MKVTPTNTEVFFDEDELIVSKTDLRGIITYANDVFLKVAGYSEAEVMGQPHNMIRHPDMPRCIFKLAWDTIQKEEEIFAYVKNMAKNGDYYWVLAHMTPSYDTAGRHIGYHSSRRVPYPDALNAIRPLYKELRAIELKHSDAHQALAASSARLNQVLAEAKLTYSQFVFSLSTSTSLDSVS